MSNDPFLDHGITHLSASQINQFIANPSQWILRVSGYKDNFGIPAMWRGKAVDQAITKALYTPEMTDQEIIRFGINKYEEDLYNTASAKISYNAAKARTELDNISVYLEIALPYFRPLGKPLAAQKRITLEFEELPIPIIGYLDLQYEGVVRDIKTVSRMPSKTPASVCRQLAIYATAEGDAPLVDYIYVTKTKREVRTVSIDDIEGHLHVVRKAAKAMMNLLATSTDISQVAQLLIPDLDDWRWSEGEREAARELWRI